MCPPRRIALAILAAAMLTGCTTSGGVIEPLPATTAPTMHTTVPTTEAPAGALLAGLVVKGRAPKTGYDRDRCGPAWTDDNGAPLGHNGCDTRNDVLRRDLVDRSVEPGTHGCVIETGTLHDPYTGQDIPFVRGVGTSEAVQIDHVVALSDAWQKGAQQWTPDERRDFANDPIELLAVDGPTNAAKGDGDTATWLPPNKPFRCAYVTRQVQIKAKYRLWVTAAEHDAMQRVLARC